MRIAIVDADLIGRKRHRFPNLACMKISGYYKARGYEVELITDYKNLIADIYAKIFISKVFTDTEIPEELLQMSNVEYGGTGFFYDKASSLPYRIEHHMPDYDLYSAWVNEKIGEGKQKREFEYYMDYSIGFMTRGCFRKCEFCVNKNYEKVKIHSKLSEFYNQDKKYICLLDDNILGTYHWENIFKELKKTKKYFQFKQGMDIRMITKKKCESMKDIKYKGDFIFAFDNIEDKEKISQKLELWRRYITKSTKLYVFCGFDRNRRYDRKFWSRDIEELFERIQILMRNQCLPYVMRFNRYEESPYKGIYINVARWCNQPSFFKKKSYREFCEANQEVVKSKICSAMKSLYKFENDNHKIVQRYFDIKYSAGGRKCLKHSR